MTITLKLGPTTRQLDAYHPRALLGRDETSCELWVHDQSVSRRHAEIYLDQMGNVFLRDLGSSNGTWVNGQPLGPQPAQLAPGQVVYIGHAPLGVEWAQPGGGRAATVMAALPPALMAQMEARKQQLMAGGGAPMTYAQPAAAPVPGYPAPQPVPGYPAPQPAPGYAAQPPGYPPPQPAPGYAAQPPSGYAAQPAAPAPAPAAAPAAPAPQVGSPAALQAKHAASNAAIGVAATVGVGGAQGPTPAELKYRKQGSNNNGTLLIALPGDTFANDNTVNGFLEFTSTDRETVASIFVELVEKHKKGPKKGHVWDRCLVRQGPWKTKKGDVLPMPFQLRTPPGTSISGPSCHWFLRGYVDISWALDIEATIDITMRNTDIEKLRDGLGALDYRVHTLESAPLGQRFTGKFNPPMHLRKQLNITDINLEIEYLGANLKVVMTVEKSKFFHRDKRQEFVFALDQLRTASEADISTHFQQEINKLMS